MRKVDGFLSRQAQEAWPTALVWKEGAVSPGNGNISQEECFILERHGVENVLLGNQFREARAGLDALLASERSKKIIEKKED
jgi:hypothetical protein